MSPRPCVPLLLYACLGALLAAGGARASSLVTLHSFAVGSQDGAGPSVPYAGLVRDGAGNLYGTSYAGGAANAGAVFKLSPPSAGQTAWSARTLYSFGEAGTASGTHPMGSLIIDVAGVLYGTTSTGGAQGGGTVFALAPPARPDGAWTQTVLTRFASGRGSPVARLLRAEDGSLFGTAMEGGTGLGSIFKLSPPAAGASDWTRTTLHAFTDARLDGQAPLTGLTADAHGALYGTTQNTAGAPGRGTVYRLTPPGGGRGAWREEVLFSFPASGAYGDRPDGDLIVGKDGALYGTAAAGGVRGRGVVYRLSPPGPAASGWNCALLYSFTGRYGDAEPEGGVVFGPRGTLVGTTGGAAKYQQGTVFELIPGSTARQSWSMQVLARFASRPRGGGLFAVGDLVAAPNGDYFGVTESGGAQGGGTVFEVRP